MACAHPHRPLSLLMSDQVRLDQSRPRSFFPGFYFNIYTVVYTYVSLILNVLQLLPRDSILARAKTFAETHHVFPAMGVLILSSMMGIGSFTFFSDATWPFHAIDLIVVVCALSSVRKAMLRVYEMRGFPSVFGGIGRGQGGDRVR